MIKNKIKEVPGLLFVTDSLEFMSAAGRRRMLEQPWMTARAQLDREQELVQALKAAMYDSGNEKAVNVLRHQLMQLHDIRTTLHSLDTHVLLDEVELFEVKNLAYLCGISRQALADLQLSERFPLPDIQGVFALLDPDGTGVPNFYIYDSYDPRLAPIRRQMKAADEAEMSGLLAQQNEVQQQVIVQLCARLTPYTDALNEALEGMAYIDFTMARAVLTHDWSLVSPERVGSRFVFQALFNPRLKQHNAEVGLRYQPVDIALTSGVTFITGANMAGKTVLLKSVGLAQLMYQFGFPIPAESCCVEPVDDVDD